MSHGMNPEKGRQDERSGRQPGKCFGVQPDKWPDIYSGRQSDRRPGKRSTPVFAVLALCFTLCFLLFGLIACSDGLFVTTQETKDEQQNRQGQQDSHDGVGEAEERKESSQTPVDSSEDSFRNNALEAVAPDGSSDKVSDSTSETPASGNVPDNASGNASDNASEAPPQASSGSEESADSDASTISVYVQVDSSRADGYGESLASKEVSIPQGASVYDALVATGLSVGGSSAYVSSIGGLAEFQQGSGSGWLYSVDGVLAGVSCGSYTLSGGESIRWIYTRDMGNDV